MHCLYCSFPKLRINYNSRNVKNLYKGLPFRREAMIFKFSMILGMQEIDAKILP